MDVKQIALLVGLVGAGAAGGWFAARQLRSRNNTSGWSVGVMPPGGAAPGIMRVSHGGGMNYGSNPEHYIHQGGMQYGQGEYPYATPAAEYASPYDYAVSPRY